MVGVIYFTPLTGKSTAKAAFGIGEKHWHVRISPLIDAAKPVNLSYISRSKYDVNNILKPQHLKAGVRFLPHLYGLRLINYRAI